MDLDSVQSTNNIPSEFRVGIFHKLTRVTLKFDSHSLQKSNDRIRRETILVIILISFDRVLRIKLKARFILFSFVKNMFIS